MKEDRVEAPQYLVERKVKVVIFLILESTSSAHQLLWMCEEMNVGEHRK